MATGSVHNFHCNESDLVSTEIISLEIVASTNPSPPPPPPSRSILFSIVGFRGAADLNVMKIATHGVFVGVLCGVFVVYLFIVLALGKNDFWILLVIFCTVSVDIYASYQTLKWSYHLNKFEKTLNGNPSLLSTERFVPGIRSPTSSLPLGTPSKTRTTAQKKASGEKSYAESREKLQRKISELQADDNISDAPTQFICPISMCVMCDPVICDDGNTYEKEYIVKWFASGKRTSPVTNVNVGNRNTLIPNIALRTQIEEWVISKDNGDRV